MRTKIVLALADVVATKLGIIILLKLGGGPSLHPPNFNFLGKPLLGEKYVEGKKNKERKRRKNNNAKFSGHYVCPRTHNVAPHALRSHQYCTTAKYSLIFPEIYSHSLP